MILNTVSLNNNIDESTFNIRFNKTIFHKWYLYIFCVLVATLNYIICKNIED